MTDQTIERNKATVERFLAGTHSANIDDVEVIDDTVVPHIACHGFPGFPGGEFHDRESYKAFFRIFRQSFSDMTFETTHTVATEEFVSAHWEIRATHSGEFQGIAPDFARVVFDGVALGPLLDEIGAELVTAEIAAIDPDKRLVRANDGSSLGFERPILATGSKLAPLPIPGAADVCHSVDTFVAAEAL